MNGTAVRWWLLLLQKPGDWIEFEPAELGITRKTLVNYVNTISARRTESFYSTFRGTGQRVGVRLVLPAGGEHGKA